MIGKHKKIWAIALAGLLAVGVGGIINSNDGLSKVSATEELAYRLTFKDSGSSSDSSTALTTSTTISAVISDNPSNVSAISSTAKVYLAKSGYGLKFGSSSAAGNITFTLVSSLTISKYVVNAIASDADATLSVNGITAQTLSTDSFSNYTFSHSSPASYSSLKIESKKASKGRLYVAFVDIYTNVASDVVTALTVTPTSKNLNTRTALAVDDYSVSITKNGASGSESDFSVNIGTGFGSSFVSRSIVTWGTTKPLSTDATIQFKSLYPTEAGGSTYLTADVALTVVVPTVSSVTITGDMTKKSYSEGDNWDPSGLTVTAVYSNGDEVDVTSDATFVYDPETATSSSITSVGIVATYDEVSSSSKTVTGIMVETYTPVGGIVSGAKYLITATSGETSYILKAGVFAAGSSGSYAETYSSISGYSETDAWTFTTNETNNQWLITGNDGTNNFGLHNNSTNNGVVSATTGTVAYEASLVSAGESSVYLKDIANNRYLTLYSTGPDWRCYTATAAQGKGSQITLVRYVSATEYSSSFLSNLVCDSSGQTAPSTSEWSALSSSFTSMSDVEKATLKNAVANESGTDIQKCVARYDYIINKYSTGTYADFMSRAPSGSTNAVSARNGSDETAAVIAISVSAVSVLSLVAFFLLKRKKAA